MSAIDEVREASKRFYNALSGMANGDAESLANIWSHSKEVTTLHPIGGREVGWEAVSGSFGKVAELASGGNVELKDQYIQVLGDIAYELGVEQGHFQLADQPITINHRVTNIYQRQAGAWKIIHHHADISPAMIEVLSHLQLAAEEAAR
jgi:ketosteroid isomerase-like protein